MTPEDDKRARDRFGMVLGLRIGGAVLIALGLYMLAGGSLGGGYGFGGVLLVAGAIGSFVVPQILARRWRTPR